MKKILIFLFIISLVFSIYLTSAKYMTFNQNFYKKEFSKNHIYDKIYNADEINEKLLGFFKDENNLPLIFNEKEASHLKDVKNIIKKGNLLLIILSLTNIVLLSLALFYSVKLKKLMLYSGIFTLVLPTPFLFFTFSNLFIKFHLLLFPQGNWIFPIDSTLISLFPNEFFYNILIRIISSSMILGFILILLGFFSSRFSSN